MLALAALLVVVPVLTLALVLNLDATDEPAEGVAGPSGWPWLDLRLSRLRVWHAVVSIALTALIFAGVFSHHDGEGFPFLLAGLLVLGLFLRAWRHELV